MPLLDKMAARINVGKIPDFKNMSVRTKHNVLRTSAAIGIGLAAAIALILITASEPGEAVHYFLMAPFLSRAYFSHLIEVIIPLLFTGSAVCICSRRTSLTWGSKALFIWAALWRRYREYTL